MRIKTKLLLGLSSKPFIILLLIASGIFQVTGLNKLSGQTQRDYDLSLISEQIQTDIKDEAINLRNLIIFTNKNSILEEINLIHEKHETIIQNINLLDSKATTTEQKEMVHRLMDTNAKFAAYIERVIALLEENKTNEAIQLIDNSGHSLHDEFFQNISFITNSFENNMKSSFANTTREFNNQLLTFSFICLIAILLSSGFIFQTVWTFARRLSNVSSVMMDVANGKLDFNTKVAVQGNDEIDDVATSFNMMVESIKEKSSKEQNMTWIKSNVAEITTSLSGIYNLEILSKTFLSKVIPMLESSHAVFYGKDLVALNDAKLFKLLASYAMNESRQHPEMIALGEGLIGQAALEKTPIILSDVPTDYIRIHSGLGETTPLHLYVFPIVYEGDVKAVLEVASFKPFHDIQHAFLEEILISMGIILESVYSRIQLAQLLEESQVLMEEIQAQSEELQSQQEELRMTNEELEEQTVALRQSEQNLQSQQVELEHANKELKEKADILEKQNEMFELTNKELEHARLALEEKAMQLELGSKYKSEFLANMSHELRTPLNSLLILSKLLADNQDGNLTEKQVEFAKTINSSGSDLLTLINDILDIAKIESGKMEVNPTKVPIKEIAAAIKHRFTAIADAKHLHFEIVLEDDLPKHIYSDEQRLLQILGNLLSNAFKFTNQGGVSLVVGMDSPTLFAFSILDTGIGIPLNKQELIFEAFQQADGTTSRRYGGTGLGLSICRELAKLLGGEIVVESEDGKGSRFTLLVEDYQGEEAGISPFIPILEEAAGREETEREWIDFNHSQTFLETKEPETHTDVHEIKRLLIVDDDLSQRNSLMELISEKDFILKAVSSGAEAIEELKVGKFDCMILDLGIGDMDGLELLAKIKTTSRNQHLHVIIYTGRDLTSKQELHMMKYAKSIIIKDKHSHKRLNDELEQFLLARKGNQDRADTGQVQIYEGLERKRILLVDDDVRNVFALMSFLEMYGMDITFAENGKESIEVLENDQEFDIILMDIMMPEMDGWEAIRRIREMPNLSTIPIIALTAKAMKEDREKCIDAGASDYIVKPFDPNQLISLIRVWLYQKDDNGN